MKANEFVKKFGWDGAFDLWAGALNLFDNNLCILSGVVCTLDNEPCFDLLALKKYIDAYDLVESKGGIEKAKAIVADSFIWCSGGRVYANPLEQAVNLLESCQ